MELCTGITPSIKFLATTRFRPRLGDANPSVIVPSYCTLLMCLKNFHSPIVAAAIRTRRVGAQILYWLHIDFCIRQNARVKVHIKQISGHVHFFRHQGYIVQTLFRSTFGWRCLLILEPEGQE